MHIMIRHLMTNTVQSLVSIVVLYRNEIITNVLTECHPQILHWSMDMLALYKLYSCCGAPTNKNINTIVNYLID